MRDAPAAARKDVLNMKATGIVRRIDDLGRVVIPKEIRRTMRIREGDPLEIYTDREGEVIFKKYSPIGELSAFAGQYAETLHKTCGLCVAICDRDSVIACAGIPRRSTATRRCLRRWKAFWKGGACTIMPRGRSANRWCVTVTATISTVPCPF